MSSNGNYISLDDVCEAARTCISKEEINRCLARLQKRQESCNSLSDGSTPGCRRVSRSSSSSLSSSRCTSSNSLLSHRSLSGGLARMDPAQADIVKKGYLTIKRPPSQSKITLKTWKRRFIVLRDDSNYGCRRLEMYTSEEEQQNVKPENFVMDLTEQIELSSYSNSKRHRLALQISPSEGVPLVLAAETEDELRDWNLAIKLLINKNMMQSEGEDSIEVRERTSLGSLSGRTNSPFQDDDRYSNHLLMTFPRRRRQHVGLLHRGSPSSSPSLEQSRRRTWSGEESIQTSDSTTDDEVERPPPPLPRPEHTLPRPLSPEQGHGYLVIMG